MFFAAAVSLILTQCVSATTMNLTVHAGEEEIRAVDLVEEDRVMIKFTVVGQTESVLDFYVTGPDGNTLASYGNVGVVSYPFVCQKAGEYRLHFSNLGHSEDKLVTLDYEIQHSIFGMPQMLFWTMVIVIVCVAAVAVFILMGKPR